MAISFYALSRALREIPVNDVSLSTSAFSTRMNSCVKTWHVWQTGSAVSEGHDFPYGEPHLAWSFNADGEAKEGLVEARDEAMDVDTQETRESRQDLVDQAKPPPPIRRKSKKFETKDLGLAFPLRLH